MHSAHKDSVKKIIESYFAAMATEPFTFAGKTYPVRALRVSPGLLRGYTCPAGCGGCCLAYTLDYLPHEVPHSNPKAMANLKPRTIELNGKQFSVMSDMQEHENRNCRNLRPEDGRCGIHQSHAFSCDFELLRFSFSIETLATNFTTRLFGRGWNMLRVVDGQRGAMCTITPPTDETKADVARKIGRLKEWCDFFEIPNRCQDILNWIKSGDVSKPLLFPIRDPNLDELYLTNPSDTDTIVA